MEKEKDLIEKLDLYDFSKQLFVSNYKLLKREKRQCFKMLHELRRRLLEEPNDYDYTNYQCIEVVLGMIYECLKIGKDILCFGVNEEKLRKFYLCLLKISLKEGSDILWTKKLF